MNNGIVFAMANPTPEIMPDEARAGGTAVIGTGRSDFPNHINNVLVFPGIFKGALSVRAKEITETMKQRAAYAIASMIPRRAERREHYSLPLKQGRGSRCGEGSCRHRSGGGDRPDLGRSAARRISSRPAPGLKP